MRKGIVGIILIMCTLCSCSRHSSQSTRINLEHSQAIAYYVDDDRISNHSEKQLHGGSYQNMAPYNMDSIFGDVYTCPPVLALIEITDVNNIELLYRFDQFKIPPKEDDDNAYLLQNSVVSARVEIVFFDPREKALQPDDEITIYSTNSVYDDHGFPVLCKGDRYYITMTDTSLLWPESYDEERYIASFYREMSDFYADASYYRRWKLDKNNLVHMVPGVLSSEAIKEEFEGNYWFALYNNDVFESELTAIMDKYVVLWEGKPIMDYVEGKKAQRSEDGE